MTSSDIVPPASNAGAYRHPSGGEALVAPFAACELRAAVRSPHRAVDLLLVERARLAKTVASGDNLLPLAGILLATSVLAPLPLGAVLGPAHVFRVALLHVGSVALCFPALHVWSCYLGGRNRLAQDFVLSLLVSAVAGLFALSFAPIVWFLRLTTAPESIEVGAATSIFLAISVLAGLVYLLRAVRDQAAALSPSRGHRLVVVAWMVLFVFVVHRMGEHLGLG
jgi:hypothetical protein